MTGNQTFEEKVGVALNALSDGALLLTGAPHRAESLVVSVVVDASRVHGRSRVAEDFGKWIVGRMVRQYLSHVDETGGWKERRPVRSPDSLEPPIPSSESDVDAMLRGMSALEAGDSDRLGQLIRDAMERLGLLERTVLWLVNVMEFDYSETSAIVGLTPIEQRETLLRTRRELQARLAVALQRESSVGGPATLRGRHGGG